MGKKVSVISVSTGRAVTDCDSAPASLEEYVTMIAGGLAGATPHMISATVTALSRIVFEFKGTSRHCMRVTNVLTMIYR